MYKTLGNNITGKVYRVEKEDAVEAMYRVAIPNTSREMYADFYERAVDEGALD